MKIVVIGIIIYVKNTYDNFKYKNQFDQLHEIVIKRCMIWVDDIMKKINSSYHDINSESHDLIQDNANKNEVCNTTLAYKDS